MESELYQRHSMTIVKDVSPKSEFKALINEFMTDAGINMGSDFTDSTLDRVIEIVEGEYKFLPIYAIGGGFRKGSLGLYEAGRLVPRTINGWMNRVSQEYNRELAHKAISTEDYSDAADLNKCPVGSAIIKKIEWLKAGLITISQWDDIPLKDIANKIKEGKYVSPKMFLNE